MNRLAYVIAQLQQDFPFMEETDFVPKEEMDTKFWDENTQHLFHGTIVDFKDSILEFGLIPQVGEFVSDAYGDMMLDWPNDDELEEILGEWTFAADLDGLEKSMNAIVFQTAHKLGKGFHDVTEDDIRANGILFVIELGKADEFMEYRPENDDDDYYRDYPPAVEPGDYYSEEDISVDSYLEGQELIDFLKKYHVWYDPNAAWR